MNVVLEELLSKARCVSHWVDFTFIQAAGTEVQVCIGLMGGASFLTAGSRLKRWKRYLGTLL